MEAILISKEHDQLKEDLERSDMNSEFFRNLFDLERRMKETPLNTPEEKEKKTIKRNTSFFRMKKDEDEDDEDYNQDISNHQSFDENESEESLDIGKGDELQELFENNVVIENNGSIDSESVVSKSFDDFDYYELSEDEVDELSRGINDLSLKKGKKN